MAKQPIVEEAGPVNRIAAPNGSLNGGMLIPKQDHAKELVAEASRSVHQTLLQVNNSVGSTMREIADMMRSCGGDFRFQRQIITEPLPNGFVKMVYSEELSFSKDPPV